MNSESLPKEYREFESAVNDINTGAMQVEYLGGGSESQVFRLAVGSEAYAVKFAKKWTRLDRPRDIVTATQRKIDAGMRGLGVDGLEQIETASPEDGVSIFDIAMGITASTMTNEEIDGVTEAELQRLVKTIDTAVELGIEFDPWNQDGSNALYLPGVGFTLIDYFVDYAKTSTEQSRDNGFKALGGVAVRLAEKYGLKL